MQDIHDQLDMFEESSRKQRVPPPKPKKPLASINLADLPIAIRPFTVVRLNPTTVIIWND